MLIVYNTKVNCRFFLLKFTGCCETKQNDMKKKIYLKDENNNSEMSEYSDISELKSEFKKKEKL